MGKASISVVKGKGSMAHNNRDFVTENVDKSRIADNIIYKQESLEDAYGHCFGEAIQNYNDKQKRADRRIDGVRGYMEQVRTSGNNEKLFYENVVQIGNMQDSGVGTEQGNIAKNILNEYMQEFQARNPNLYVFNAVMHLDEATPHLHIDYIPLADGYQRGLAVRNSLDRALKQQGVEGKANKYENRTMAWQNREKDHIETVMKRHGLEREEDTGLHRKHKSNEHYKTTVDIVHNEVASMPDQIEHTPFMLSKDKVVVKRADLEQLEERAKLSVVHEDATRTLVSGMQKKYQDSTLYSANKMNMALMYQVQAEEGLDKVQAEYKKATEMREKAEKLYSQQVDLNKNFNKIAKAYKSQQQTIEALKTENTSLKALVDDLRRNMEQSIQQAIKPLQEQLESLRERMRGVAMGEVTLIKAMRYVSEFFSGEVSKEILDSAIKTGNRFLTEDGYEDLANPEKGLPKSIARNMTIDLTFQKGDEGLGVYSPKGTCVMNFKSIAEAKDHFPNCSIQNLTIDKSRRR